MSDEKPREFWIEFVGHWIGQDRVHERNPHLDKAVHVIEHSAYEALEKELTLTCSRAAELCKENEALRSALEKCEAFFDTDIAMLPCESRQRLARGHVGACYVFTRPRQRGAQIKRRQ